MQHIFLCSFHKSILRFFNKYEHYRDLDIRKILNLRKRHAAIYETINK